jgi:hypothetical protein
MHARKQVVDVKNTLGGQFYFVQARLGGPIRVRPGPNRRFVMWPPGRHAQHRLDSTITTDFALTLDFVPHILQGAIASKSAWRR